MSIGLIVSLVAAGASAYVKGQSQKEYAKAVGALRSQQAEQGERRAREQEALTRETSKKFQPEERTALTEQQDQKNRESLGRLHENLNVGPEEGSEQSFAGKVSEGFTDKLAGQRKTTKQRGEALREAAARFNSIGQSGQEETQLLRNLGLDNNTIKSFLQGDQRAIDAKIAGLTPGGQGLGTFLDALALASGAYAIGTAGGAGASGTGATSVPITEAEFLADGAVAGSGSGAGAGATGLGMKGGSSGIFSDLFGQPFNNLDSFGRYIPNKVPNFKNPFNYNYLR